LEFLPNTDRERLEMQQAIGIGSIDELFSAVPEKLKLNRELQVGEGMSEIELMRKMRGLADKNTVYRSIFRGAGAYNRFIPEAVEALSSRGEFVTAYTPYQAEMSQGILQSIFEYQTIICRLTGMDISNASVYDGASAAGEAVKMCLERKAKKAVLLEGVNPRTAEVIKTYAVPVGMEVVTVSEDEAEAALAEGGACLYFEQPNYYGKIVDAEKLVGIAHAAKAKAVMGVNAIAMALLKTPGEVGADVAVGDGQALGLPMAFGGPYVGFMACKDAMKRKLPGRIVGQTTDDEGRRAFVLTMQAREQHIRREKAGSNICSNQAWCALRVAMYTAMMGPEGLREAAELCYAGAHYLADGLEKAGLKREEGEFFCEFVTDNADGLEEALAEQGILSGLPLEGGKMLWCVTEMNTKEDIDEVISIVKEVRNG